MPLQPAVLGTARLNNFRLNYLTAAQAAVRPSHVWILIGGVDVTNPASSMRALYKSLTIRDIVFDAPNTCALTLYGGAPNVGLPIEVWVNSNAPQLLFNGELQTVERTYKGRPATVIHPVTAIDDTARANRKRPLRPYVNVSASTRRRIVSRNRNALSVSLRVSNIGGGCAAAAKAEHDRTSAPSSFFTLPSPR